MLLIIDFWPRKYGLTLTTHAGSQESFLEPTQFLLFVTKTFLKNEQLGARPVLLGQSTQSLERIYQDQPNREWINISTAHPSKILVETSVTIFAAI